jgi:hypothetical protein
MPLPGGAARARGRARRARARAAGATGRGGGTGTRYQRRFKSSGTRKRLERSSSRSSATPSPAAATASTSGAQKRSRIEGRKRAALTVGGCAAVDLSRLQVVDLLSPDGVGVVEDQHGRLLQSDSSFASAGSTSVSSPVPGATSSDSKEDPILGSTRQASGSHTARTETIPPRSHPGRARRRRGLVAGSRPGRHQGRLPPAGRSADDLQPLGALDSASTRRGRSTRSPRTGVCSLVATSTAGGAGGAADATGGRICGPGPAPFGPGPRTASRRSATRPRDALSSHRG